MGVITYAAIKKKEAANRYKIYTKSNLQKKRIHLIRFFYVNVPMLIYHELRAIFDIAVSWRKLLADFMKHLIKQFI